ncbi:MAG: sigma-70 family RNA polymerase sigma factor [Acidobacteria bacterium]|nr:sigma-70 family RNA polymerase sigma factor [Acidobacteriota bacterium]
MTMEAGVVLDGSAGWSRADGQEPPDEVARENAGGYAVDSIRAYLGDLGKFPRLTAEREVELAQLIAAGGPEGAAARQRMIETNLRLVVFIAKRFANRGVELLDLVSAGNLALMDAVGKFKPKMGCRFSAFAGIRIMRAINLSIGELTRTVRLPQHVSESLRKMAKAQLALHRELDRDPDVYELAERAGMRPKKVRALLQVGHSTTERAGMRPKKVRALLQVGHSTTSLDAPVGDDKGSRRLVDMIPATGRPREWGLVDSLVAELRAAGIEPRAKGSRARLGKA